MHEAALSNKKSDSVCQICSTKLHDAGLSNMSDRHDDHAPTSSTSPPLSIMHDNDGMGKALDGSLHKTSDAELSSGVVGTYVHLLHLSCTFRI